MKAQTKNILKLTGVLLVGLLLGWLIFGGKEPPSADHDHSSEIAGNTLWTCSMHPQIQQSEPGQCPLCGMDLIPMTEDSGEGNAFAVRMTEDAMKLANISTMIVGARDAQKELRLNGKIQVDERKVYAQTTHIPGRVEQLTINFTGEEVRRGQTLAMVYSPDLVTAQEELLQAASIKNSQPELFEASKQKLRNWKIGDGMINKILTSGKTITRFPIGADVNGIVTNKMVSLGEYIEGGSVLYEIADLSAVWLLFDVYESDIPWVKVGDRVKYTIQSLPGESFEGTISFIDPFIDPQTRVATARVEIKNTNQKFKPEMFATGIIENNLNTKENNELVIPKSAVMWTGERSVVYIKEGGINKVSFALREVTLGPGLGDAYVVKSGLESGEEIVVNGTFTVDAAAQLAGKPSMMNPQGGPAPTGHHHGSMTGNDTMSSDMNKAAKTSPKVTVQLEKVVMDYLNLKDALVNDENANTSQILKAMQKKMQEVPMNEFEGDAHHQWMDFKSKIEENLNKMLAAPDLTEKRDVFEKLSMNMINLSNTFGPFSKPLFIQHCPMADNNKGAYWLSLSREVKNPYFGAVMLTCGDVKGEIK